MGWLDKLLGRGKKTAGAAIDSPSLEREGEAQEREGDAEQRAELHEEAAAESRREAAEHQADREGL